MINHGIMFNVSKGNFTHNRFLRADHTVLTSKDYEFVNFLYGITSNAPVNKCEAKLANCEHAQHGNLKNFYFADVTKTKCFGAI